MTTYFVWLLVLFLGEIFYMKDHRNDKSLNI